MRILCTAQVCSALSYFPRVPSLPARYYAAILNEFVSALSLVRPSA